MDTELVIAIAGVVIGVLGWITSARKSRVDYLVKILDAQNERIDDLENDVVLWRGYSEYLRDGVRVLIAQLCRIKVLPDFDPVGPQQYAIDHKREGERGP